jgi:CDP-diacylglycerol--glycerol-3-phosphate 3-phosphatidyltransferase
LVCRAPRRLAPPHQITGATARLDAYSEPHEATPGLAQKRILEGHRSGRQLAGPTGVHPNTITVIGTLCTIAGGTIYAMGHISIGGWFLGMTALFDVLDGTVARRSNRSSTFGAFLDSTLDRVADGALLGGTGRVLRAQSRPPQRSDGRGLSRRPHRGVLDVVHPSRAEALGVDAKVGMVQRPERIVLLSAPQAFFGLAFNGWVLGVIIVFLSVTAWITVVQRMVAVYEQTTERAATPPIPLTTEKTFWLRRKRRTGTRR